MQPSKCTESESGIPAAGFPKSSRLRKRSEFLNLSNVGNKSSVKGFLVIWSENSVYSARLGITASKKVGSAVVRNRVKRYLREIFRHNRLLLASVDLNIIARREAAQMDYFDVQRELNKAFRLIGATVCSRASCSL